MSLREYFNGTQSNMSNDSPGALLPQIKHEVETLTLTPNSLDFPVFWHAGLIYGEMLKSAKFWLPTPCSS